MTSPVTTPQYDKAQHTLVAQVAHKWRIHEQPEMRDLIQRLEAAGLELFSIKVSDWPPVSKPPLQISRDNPFEGQTWMGFQLAFATDSTSNVESFRRGDYVRYKPASTAAHGIAKDMCGDTMAPHRLAYQWQVPEFDSELHVIIRTFLAENDVDIVDFYNKFLPSLKSELDHDPVLEVANPKAAEEKRKFGQWTPTRRVFRVEDKARLDRYVQESNPFEYNMVQSVCWQRSLDDSRWEARRQVAPQSAEWLSHKSYIVRPIGSGAWSEADRDSINGHAFGPYMELHDDGKLRVWVAPRAKKAVADNPMHVNGVEVYLSPTDEVSNSLVVGASLEPEDMETILSNKIEPTSSGGQGNVEAWKTISTDFSKRGPFWHAKAQLPSEYHRDNNTTCLVVREYETEGELRAFGSDVLATAPIMVNGVPVNFAPWRDGAYKTSLSLGEMNRVLKRQVEIDKTPPPPVVIPRRVPEGKSPAVEVAEDAVAYPPHEIKQALRETLGNQVRLFGRQISDSVVMALTPEGAKLFLEEDVTNLRDYVGDAGGRNYDCDDFAESIRVHLSERYGLNSIGIIWGDKHAWNFFVLAGERGPDIMMFEPQSDKEVSVDDGMYSIQRRCEVLL